MESRCGGATNSLLAKAMPDERVTALLREHDLRAVVVHAGVASRHARSLAGLLPASAELLAQGLTAVALMSALQKDSSRINLQMECDGPVRGLFVDGDVDGNVRGYVKNKHLEYTGAAGPFHWRPALGNSGYLSVLKDTGDGEPYRSSVTLAHFELAEDLENYFAQSEQLETRIFLRVVPRSDEPLAVVLGVLLQPLPTAERGALDRCAKETEGLLEAVLHREPQASAAGMVKQIFPGVTAELTARIPLAFRCSCSPERVRRALIALGKDELRDMLAKEGQAEVTCEFCSARYFVSGDEIKQLLSAIVV